MALHRQNKAFWGEMISSQNVEDILYFTNLEKGGYRRRSLGTLENQGFGQKCFFFFAIFYPVSICMKGGVKAGARIRIGV